MVFADGVECMRWALCGSWHNVRADCYWHQCLPVWPTQLFMAVLQEKKKPRLGLFFAAGSGYAVPKHLQFVALDNTDRLALA